MRGSSVELQESGVAAPSTTVIGGKLAIRAAIVNHRTQPADLDALVERTVALGRSLADLAARSTAAVQIGASDWPPRLAREAALRQLEARIAAEPETIGPRLERARLLTELDRTLEARNAYLEILARAPAASRGAQQSGHAAVCHRLSNGSANSLCRGGGTSSGGCHQPRQSGQRALSRAGEFEAARGHYETALRLAPDHAEAHQGISYVLAELGDAERAGWHRREGFGHRAVQALPYRGEGPPVSLLLLISAVGGNIPTRSFLDDRVFETTVVVPEFYDLNQPLPRHQLVFNAIGDADLNVDALRAAQSLGALSGAPVLNAPSAVLATGRSDNAQRLARLSGVVAPATVTLSREALSSPDAATSLARHGLKFPLLLRTPGFHTGRHFVRVEQPGAALAEAVAGLPGAELTAIEYLDSRGPDGKVRKYRVMMIDGRLYPLHVAISSHWKIHYFTAEMAERAEHRAEDAEFLENMPAVLGPRAMTALEQIQGALGLDYAGIDFGLNAAGDLLLFEANATMVVNPPEPDERWAYRRPAVERIFGAVRGMLMRKARAANERE